MIRRLRIRHRASFAVLAIALPIGLVAAFSARRSVPPSPDAYEDRLPGPDRRKQVNESKALAGDVVLHLRTWDDDRIVRRVLEVRPERDLELPDVLVYWSPSQLTGELPDDGVLLGALAGSSTRRFALPRDALGGRLYWYSLAHQELIASVEFDR